MPPGESLLIFCAVITSLVSADLKLGIITTQQGPTQELRHHTESLIASLSTEPFSVIWINTTTDSLDTTAALTRVWSHYKFDVLFGSAGRCSTQLELSAAWKIPVITTACPSSELTHLRELSSLHWSHIRMDVTRYSTLPYLEALYRDRQVLVTAASLRHNADAQLIMSHLSTRRVNIHVCTYNCTGASAAGTDLIVFGESIELEFWLSQQSQLPWSRVILAMDKKLQLAKFTSLSKVIGYKNISVLQPETKLENVSLEDSLTFYIQARQSLFHSNGQIPDARTLVNNMKNTCTQVGDRMICLDQQGWNIGAFSLWSMNECNQESGFRKSAKFLFINQWEMLTEPCKENAVNTRQTGNEFGASEIALILICVCLTILLCGIAALLWTKRRRELGLVNWRIDYAELQLSLPTIDSKSDTDEKCDHSRQFLECSEFGHYQDKPITLRRITASKNQVNTQFSKMVKVRHDNIVTFYGGCVQHPDIIMVNERCDDSTLQDVLRDRRLDCNEELMASFLMDLMSGLTHLHLCQLSHGNLTSSACKISSNGILKLGSFGLAKFDPPSQLDKLWLAPEVIRGKITQSQSADVYSFGIILYEMIGGEGPFGDGYSYTSTEIDEILVRVGVGGYHPQTSRLHCEDYVKQCMTSCWRQQENKRTDLHTLAQLLCQSAKHGEDTEVDVPVGKLESLEEETQSQLMNDAHITLTTSI